VLAVRGRRRHLAEILTGRERLARTGDDDGAHGAVVEQLAQRVPSLEPHALVEGVALFRTVPGDDGDAAAALDEDGFSAHASRYTTRGVAGERPRSP
jgi:hypothetical protein